jgi:outer membrane receptor for ferrienterochelin and colicin
LIVNHLEIVINNPELGWGIEMTNNSNLLRMAVLIVSTCYPALGYAQAVVEAERTAPIALDPITVTATRSEKQVLDVPGTVSVITRQELDERITRDTQDIVRYQPGISVNRQTTSTDPSAIMVASPFVASAATACRCRSTVRA